MNVEESFPSAVSGPKKTSAKIHRRNSASACVQAAVGARVGAQRGGEDPAEMVGEHRSVSAPGLRTLSFLVSKMPPNCQSRSSRRGWSEVPGISLLKWYKESPFFHLLRLKAPPAPPKRGGSCRTSLRRAPSSASRGLQATSPVTLMSSSIVGELQPL